MEMDDLPKEFTHKMAPGNIIRANLRTEKDALKWINLFSKRTNTNWIVYKTKTPPKFLLDKKWICGHNRKNKKENETSTGDCEASIDIKIKRLTKGTKNSDQYLSYNPPLTAVISVNLQHKHDSPTVAVPVSSRAQKQNEEMKEQFYKYFSKGMNTVQALNHHIKLSLSDNQSQEDDVDLGDVTFQPKKIMYTWFEDWKKLKKRGKKEPMVSSDDQSSEEEMPEEDVNNSDGKLIPKHENDTESSESAELVDVKSEVDDCELFDEVKESTLQELQKVFALLGGDGSHLNMLQSINSNLKGITTKDHSVEFLNVLGNALSSVN